MGMETAIQIPVSMRRKWILKDFLKSAMTLKLSLPGYI